MAKVIIGFLAIVLGGIMVWKAEWLYQNFGANAWAEKTLGTEVGSRLFYKLIGLVIILVGILTMTGLIQGIILSIFSKIFMIK